jgi:uncharacterized membrane protein YkvA (DUF1232 family)
MLKMILGKRISMNDEQLDFYQKIRREINLWLETKVGKEHRWSEYLFAAPDLFHLLCKLAVDSDVPNTKKIKLAAALVYFISPIDFLPELFLGPIGYLDDISLAALILNDIVVNVNPKLVKRHWSGDTSILNLIKTIAANANQIAGAGVWKKIKKIFWFF